MAQELRIDWSDFSQDDYHRLQADLRAFKPSVSGAEEKKIFGSIYAGDTAFDVLESLTNPNQTSYHLSTLRFYPHPENRPSKEIYAEVAGFAYDSGDFLTMPDPLVPLKASIERGMDYPTFQQEFIRMLRERSRNPRTQADRQFLKALHRDSRFFQRMQAAAQERRQQEALQHQEETKPRGFAR